MSTEASAARPNAGPRPGPELPPPRSRRPRRAPPGGSESPAAQAALTASGTRVGGHPRFLQPR